MFDGSDGKRGDRDGTRLFGAHIEDEIHHTVKVALAKLRKSSAAGMHEMIADWLMKHGEAIPPELVRALEQFERIGRRRMSHESRDA